MTERTVAEAAQSALDEFDNVRWDDVWANLQIAGAEELAGWTRKYVGYVRHDIEEALRLAALSSPETTPAGVLPPNTRLILASDNLLDEWGTRTERGERITVEWGEPSPEGWYQPVFTVHSDDRAGVLDEAALRVAAWRLSNAAASLARHAQSANDPAHRSWFPSAIADVLREVDLARHSAGAEPDAAEYAAALGRSGSDR